MENGGVYRATTEAHPASARGPRSSLAAYFTLGRLKGRRRYKFSQLVLSLLAFICEEIVSQCTLCGGLYFFEFVSCSAFLLSLLMLIVYCTPVYEKVEHVKLKSSVFGFLASLTFLFECIIMLLKKLQERRPRKPEATPRSEHVTEPLNA
ncbi:CKLF-like MARVEL transmembrane domain-containing protein 6 isoform X2 [Camelus ferus]|uniref:CKLF-like MARVEL transmembrane domain-containing protein 6 isoform X2 n=1 Tax=Camelus ferus TaxID=419612 RepID=A0A8B8RBA0_CAMFR|nr:CKLF-like MARVEL transmembrane domain-containing protein 6 isoform X2 [Camelus ferus]